MGLEVTKKKTFFRADDLSHSHPESSRAFPSEPGEALECWDFIKLLYC